MPEIRNFNRAVYLQPTQKSEDVKYIRSQHYRWQSSLDTDAVFIHALNSYGFRDEPWERHPGQGKQRIMMIGDSYVEGVMVEASENIPSQFQEALGEDVEVMNAGMNGVGLPCYVAFMHDAVPLFKPDKVLLVLFSNDIAELNIQQNRQPLLAEEVSWFKPRLIDLLKLIANGEGLPMRFPLKTIPFHSAVPDPANPWTKNEENYKAHVQDKVAEAMKAGTFNYFRLNWLKLQERMLKVDVDLTEEIVFMANKVRATGAEFAVVYIPDRHQVTDYYLPYELAQCQLVCSDITSLTGATYNRHAQQISAACEQSAVPFLDLTSKLVEAESNGKHLYWNYEDHMRARGYKLCAQEIASWWKTAVELP